VDLSSTVRRGGGIRVERADFRYVTSTRAVRKEAGVHLLRTLQRTYSDWKKPRTSPSNRREKKDQSFMGVDEASREENTKECGRPNQVPKLTSGNFL